MELWDLVKRLPIRLYQSVCMQTLELFFLSFFFVYVKEEFEWVIRIFKSKDKHTHTTNDRVTQIPLKTGGELKCSGKISRLCIVLQLLNLIHQ